MVAIVVRNRQRWSYYANLLGSIIGESIMVSLDDVYLDNQSHYRLDREFLSVLCNSQSLVVHIAEMNKECHELNPTCRKTVHEFS